MKSIKDIIFKECLNDSEVYLYEEEGKWYAYYHSAVMVSNGHSADCIIKEMEIPFLGMFLQKIEVNLQGLLDKNWRVELCADHEITLV